MKDSYEIKMTQFLKHAYTEVEKHANQLLINENIPQHSFVVALYSRICELAGSCIILIDYKVTTGIPILVRGILEAYVDLINLCDDPSYINFMQASLFEEWLRILNEAKTKQNPNLIGTSQMEALPEHIKLFQEEQKRLNSKGFKALSIKEKFNKASMGNVYMSSYNMLCCYSHHNMRSLIDINADDEEQDNLIISGTGASAADLPYYVTLICNYLIDGSCRIHKLLNSSSYSEIVKLNAEMETIKQDSEI